MGYLAKGDLVKARGARWIGLVGHSLGAAIALLTAKSNRSVAAVCRVAGRVSETRPLHFLTPSQQQILADTGTVGFTSRGETGHGRLAGPPARRLLLEPLLHADSSHVHSAGRRLPIEAHSDERIAAKRRTHLGAQGPR